MTATMKRLGTARDRRTKWPAGWSVTAMIGLILLLTTGCADRHTTTAVGGKELYAFISLPQMVATSDVIVDGTVDSTQPGRVVGEGDAALQFTQVDLKVNEVLFGSLSSPSVTIEEGGLEGNHPSKVGDTGIYFLHEKVDAPGIYRLVNSQSRFLETSKGTLLAPNDEAQWVKSIEGMTLDELKALIATAVNAVEEGKVAPASPAI